MLLLIHCFVAVIVCGGSVFCLYYVAVSVLPSLAIILNEKGELSHLL